MHQSHNTLNESQMRIKDHQDDATRTRRVVIFEEDETYFSKACVVKKYYTYILYPLFVVDGRMSIPLYLYTFSLAWIGGWL